jgi:hypothetical protein
LTQLQAQAEQEMQLAFNSITEEVLNGGLEATAVTNIQKRQLVQLMTSKPQLFQVHPAIHREAPHAGC